MHHLLLWGSSSFWPERKERSSSSLWFRSNVQQKWLKGDCLHCTIHWSHNTMLCYATLGQHSKVHWSKNCQRALCALCTALYMLCINTRSIVQQRNGQSVTSLVCIDASCWCAILMLLLSHWCFTDFFWGNWSLNSVMLNKIWTKACYDSQFSTILLVLHLAVQG